MLVVGDFGVGKTSLIIRFAEGEFSGRAEMERGTEFKMKSIKLGESSVKLQIWDTLGQEKSRTLTSSYYRGAQGVMIVYDCTERDTFTSVKDWLCEVEHYACENITKILVGNKIDLLADPNETKAAQDFAASLNIPFIEVSAKNGQNVAEAFQSLPQADDDLIRLDKADTKAQKKKGCC